MTVAVPGEGTAVEPYDPSEYGDVGLEDISAADVVIPRLQIQHTEGTFKDNLSNAVYDKLTVVLLGLVKQRIMWADEIEDGDKPLCKSSDFEHGFPNVREDVAKDKRFPWGTSNFDPANFPAQDGLNGLVTLPCSSCIFQQWDKGDWKQPPCAEQHTYPLFYSPDEGDTWTPALLTVQKTGIRPSRTYVSSFAQTKTPMFTVFTELTLDLSSRGTVKYSVPKFKRLTTTPRENWSEYAATLRSIREFIRQPPRRRDDDEGDTPAAGNVNEAPESKPEPAPAAKAAASAPAPVASSEPDSDLPF